MGGGIKNRRKTRLKGKEVVWGRCVLRQVGALRFAPSPPLPVSNGSTPSSHQPEAKGGFGLSSGSKGLIAVNYSWCRRALWVSFF